MGLGFLAALRPHQWVKNLFVAAPLVFARRIYDSAADLKTAAAVVSFCMLSSAVYLFNDLMDVEKDRAHPTKRNRPIASGRISPALASLLASLLAAVGFSIGLWVGAWFLAAAGAYLVLNASYSLGAKKVPFLDVTLISLMFLTRVLAGSVAIPVEPSRWLLACTVLLAGLLGFGKRAHELRLAGEAAASQRDVLHRYKLETLHLLLRVLGVLTTATYAAYTQSEHALAFFETRALVFTAPFVAFGIFRFVWLSESRPDAESPTDSMLRDRPFMVNLALYALGVFVIIY